MTANKPRLIVTEERRPTGLGSVTWEQRQGYRDRSGARLQEHAGAGMTRALSRLILRQALALMDHPIGIAVAAMVIIYIDLLATR